MGLHFLRSHTSLNSRAVNTTAALKHVSRSLPGLPLPPLCTWRNVVTSAALLLASAGGASAADSCEPVIGHVATVEGRVEFQRQGDTSWKPAALESTLCQGDSVRVGERSRAAVTLANEAVLRLDQNTTIQLVNVNKKAEESSFLKLIRGALESFSRKPRRFEVSTPYLNGSIEGTEFVFRVQDDESVLTVLEGRVRAANDHGKIVVAAGEAASAKSGAAPQQRIVVHPRDAVQWSLYYPPVLAAGEARGQAGRDAEFHLGRAAQLLSVGQVTEARRDIDQALTLDPKLGGAFALRAVINVVQNNREQALTDAQQAVALSPEATSPAIALSYAQQASFRIEDARDTMLKAVVHQPNDALAWARLAELWLMLGYREHATEAANKAAALSPSLPRTQITFGFAALAEFRPKAARAAFERAIELDSSDPLPRLGLGLAKIGDGKLEEGRRDLAVAVALDSNNALLRDYLGKAYFEEKRSPLDAEQFVIAKQLDPLDPTAFFYDGVRKQTENHPVGALDDVQKSIELNDNRATYRGRLLLDKDRAARGTSLARIYNDLGFPQLGANEATASLALDPANSSAHRFLSDTYRNAVRHEIARVSELLQAQMTQEVNINPVQPSLGQPSPTIVTRGGPANPGFNEFTPLFEQNMTQLNMSGFEGSNQTHGGEVVVSGVYDRWSFSAGGSSFDTNGWRPNNGIQQDVGDLYAQVAVSPVMNLQAEYRRRRTQHGDLAFRFDPNDYLDDLTRNFNEESTRVGAKLSLSPASTLLLSVIAANRTDKVHLIDNFLPGTPFPPRVDYEYKTQIDEDTTQGEAQYLYQGNGFNITTGLSQAKVDPTFKLDSSLFVTPSPPYPGEIPQPPFKIKPDITDKRAYFYGNVRLPAPVTWTFGASYQSYAQDDFELHEREFNPKFGMLWDVTDSLRVRVAAFKVMKPALAANQSLEPTQIAGFNQLYDDTNATKSKSYGAALDWRASRSIYMGVESTHRAIEEPAIVYGGTTGFENRDEWIDRAYVYWTPAMRWSVSAEAVYDKYEAEEGSQDPNLPRNLRTVTLPFRVQYFHPSGFFGGVSATVVEQNVRRSGNPGQTEAEGDDQFTITDLMLGYRLPRRRGIVSVAVQNVFDQQFKYQDDSFRTFQDEASVAPYTPERTLMGRVTLSF